MLHFFRKHQQYFFILITIVIVISFSFFGTYGTIDESSAIGSDETAFAAINGEAVSRRDVELMTLFLSSDSEDKKLYGGAWGPNFLNDGVFKNDFLASGLATQLASHYRDLIEEEISARHSRERKYKLYTHPQAKFIGTETAWSYFAPRMSQNFRQLKEAKTPLAEEAFSARIELFLGEKKIPAPTLQQILNYQQRQYNWVTPDPALQSSDLSLFGYHTTEDWFGPTFLRLVSEVIINGAIEAKARGYEVSKEESLASLKRNASVSFQENEQSPSLGATNSTQYFHQQLMRMGIDQAQAVALWQQVLLFRRLFNDMGSSMFATTQPFDSFNRYAGESAEGFIYRLPEALRIAEGGKGPHKLKAYLDAVSTGDSDSLLLPRQFLSAEEVKKKNPELVQKRYLVEVADFDTKDLHSRIPLKDVWAWESLDTNWKLLQEQFPSLGTVKANDKEERLQALDALDTVTRNKVDATARAAIITAHPEWITEGLDKAEAIRKVIAVTPKGGKSPLFGIGDREKFIEQLDTAPTGSTEASAWTQQEKSAAEALSNYSGNGSRHYRLTVIDRSGDWEVATFEEAEHSQALDDVIEDKLNSYYIATRSSNPTRYQNLDGSWKPYSEVADSVADSYISDTLKAAAEDYSASNKSGGNKGTAASLRLYRHMSEVKKEIESGTNEQRWAAESEKEEEVQNDSLPDRVPLSEQWNLVKSRFGTGRRASHKLIDSSQALAMDEGDLSSVVTPPNGDLYFYRVESQGSGAIGDRETAEHVELAHRLLSDTAQQALMSQLIEKIDAAGAIGVGYIRRESRTEEVNVPS